jgi:MtN3 and saliva related transmembrane protein
MMALPIWVEAVGSIAAVITTLCWLPQAWQILKTKDAAAVSLPAYLAFLCGIVLWLVYGVYLESVPLIGANAVTGTIVIAIIALKLRYGGARAA